MASANPCFWLRRRKLRRFEVSPNKHLKLIAHSKAGHASGHRYCLRIAVQ